MEKEKKNIEKFIPDNSIELAMLTIEGALATEDKELNFGRDEQIFNIFQREWSLGNITPKNHDIRFIENKLGAASDVMLLRGGKLKRGGISMMTSPMSMVRTSLSINGFLQKIVRTEHLKQTNTENDNKKKGFFSIFKNQG